MIQSKVSEKSEQTETGKGNYFLKEDEKFSNRKGKTKKPGGTNINDYAYNLFSKIQLLILCLTLVLVPIALFPLEWVMFEYGKVLVLIVFTIILLTFELVKFFIRGRVEIYKSPADMILILLGLSFFVSLFFSSDFLVSFWGYEYRFGTGFISIISILIYLLILKSTIKTTRGILALISSLTLGLLISALLSILSFQGINPFGFILEFEKFFFTGLPLFNSARLSIVIWSLGIILTLFVFYNLFYLFSNDESYLNKNLSLAKAYRKKRFIQFLLLCFFLFLTSIFVLAISLFSIKDLVWFGVVSLSGVVVLFLILSFLCTRNVFKYTTVLFLILGITIFGASRLSVVQDSLSIESDNLVGQVILENEDVWNITISTLSESFSRSLVGLGNDNFVVAYSLYRPAFSGDVDLNFVNYSYANNEIYNIVTNRGLIGLFVWLFIGFLIAKQFIQYITDESKKKILNNASRENVGIIVLNLFLIYVWFASFFVYYSFILYFVFFVLLVLSSLLKNISYKMNSERFVIQTNFFIEKIGMVRSDSMPKFFIFLIFLLSIFSLYYVSNDVISRVYAIKGESVLYDMDRGLIGGEENREEMFQKVIQNYDEAIERNPNNYVFRRKVSLVLMEYISKVLSLDYSNLTDEEQRQDFFRIVSIYADAAREESKKATDLAPTIPVNWTSRDLIYSDLVKMGFRNYLDAAVKVSEQSLIRNPNNYNPYINKATYLYLLGDAGGAISYARQALEINPYYIPGLVLAGEISMGLEDFSNAKRYLESAKSLLEELDFSRVEVFNLYQQVNQNLEYIWSVEVESTQFIDDVEEELTLPDDEVSD